MNMIVAISKKSEKRKEDDLKRKERWNLIFNKLVKYQFSTANLVPWRQKRKRRKTMMSSLTCLKLKLKRKNKSKSKRKKSVSKHK